MTPRHPDCISYNHTHDKRSCVTETGNSLRGEEGVGHEPVVLRSTRSLIQPHFAETISSVAAWFDGSLTPVVV
ncbi:hypothetical protein RRF57_010886 [Xylaria bambusicola]|uniref:Uncharacterized protein n=1 Tax=Xylaria bambusicola TaxID=326684 RepID=A0AAN7V232_9PEZI